MKGVNAKTEWAPPSQSLRTQGHPWMPQCVPMHDVAFFHHPACHQGTDLGCLLCPCPGGCPFWGCSPFVGPISCLHCGIQCTQRNTTPPQNTCMGQGIITLGWVLCPRARSCSTLMCPFSRVTLTPQLGTPAFPHGYCYHGVLWPTFPMLRSPGLDIQT